MFKKPKLVVTQKEPLTSDNEMVNIDISLKNVDEHEGFILVSHAINSLVAYLCTNSNAGTLEDILNATRLNVMTALTNNSEGAND